MSTRAIIEASDIACASAAVDLSVGNGLPTNQRVALVAQLFADHRAKAESADATDAARYRFLRSKRNPVEYFPISNGWVHAARAWRFEGEILTEDACDAIVDLARQTNGK